MESLEIQEKIIEILRKNAVINADNVTEKSRIKTDLGIDSLKLVDVVMDIEAEFSIEVDIASLTADNFSNAERITEFVKSNMK